MICTMYLYQYIHLSRWYCCAGFDVNGLPEYSKRPQRRHLAKRAYTQCALCTLKIDCLQLKYIHVEITSTLQMWLVCTSFVDCLYQQQNVYVCTKPLFTPHTEPLFTPPLPLPIQSLVATLNLNHDAFRWGQSAPVRPTSPYTSPSSLTPTPTSRPL